MSNKRCKLLGAVILAVLCFCPVLLADLVSVRSISVFPTAPAILDSIQITTGLSESYAGDIDFVGTNFHVSGTVIDINFYFFDNNPGGMRFAWSDEYAKITNIGLLPAGTYSVISNAWIRDNIAPSYRLADSESTSFIVTPEPASLLLFGSSALGLLLKRRKQEKGF